MPTDVRNTQHIEEDNTLSFPPQWQFSLVIASRRISLSGSRIKRIARITPPPFHLRYALRTTCTLCTTCISNPHPPPRFILRTFCPLRPTCAFPICVPCSTCAALIRVICVIRANPRKSAISPYSLYWRVLYLSENLPVQ